MYWTDNKVQVDYQLSLHVYVLFLTYKLDNNIKKMGTGKHVLPDGAGRWLGNYNRDGGHSNSII